MKIFLYTDGGSKNNPGEAGCAWMAEDGNGQVILEGSKRIGIETSNIAEYRALYFGLTELSAWLSQKGIPVSDVELTCISDSALLVNQMAGTWKVKADNIRRQRDGLMVMIGRWGFRILYQQVPPTDPKISHVNRMYNEAMKQ
jgi:ribonuclease HI